MSQAQPRQQLTLQDSQMLQQQLMLKQWQELQKHRQIPEFSDGRQQNYLNQQSENSMSANKSLMPHGTSATVQGFPSGSFSPTASSKNNYNQYSHLQESNNQAENHAMQSLYGKPFLDVNQNISQGLCSFTNEAFRSEQSTKGKNLFGQVHNEGFQQMSSLQMNASAQQFNSWQQQRGSSEQFQEKTRIDPFQGAATLDPLEQKILFNIEGPNTTLECSDYLSSFPSIESGSLSALMQTAVGESSSDHGPVQEEWDGRSFHNTKLSMDNQHSDWVDNNVVSSLNGKSQAPSGATNMSPGFPGFQPNQKREGISHSPHESTKQGQSIKGSQLNHMIQPPLGNTFPFQSFQPDGHAGQSNIFAKSRDQMSIPPSFGSSFDSRVQQGNHDNVTSSTGSVFTKNQHQMYSSADLKNQSPQATLPKMTNKLPPFDLFIPRSASQSSSSFDLVSQQFPILEAAPVESSRKPPSPWEKMLLKKCQPETEPQELPSNSQLSLNPRALSEVVGQSAEQTGIHHGLEPVAKNLSEENSVSSSTLMGHPHQVNFDGTQGCDKQVPSVSARDFEAFGRSLKPSNLHPNYSSSSEIKHEMNSVTGPSTSTFLNPYASRDMNMQFIKPSSLATVHNNAEQMGSQGPSFSHTDLNVSGLAFDRTHQSQANTQMASWFNQYAPLRNGQMLSMTAKNSTHPSSSGRQMENLEMITPVVPSDATGNNQDQCKLSHPSTSHSDVGDMDLSMTRSGKRKITTSDLLPWHIEVAQSSKSLQSISKAEMEWAKAANRLIDKVDNEVNVIKDAHPLLRPKKRLALTTQLMQHILTPAPSATLHTNATLDFESLAYFSAKSALGDACNLNSWSINGSGLSYTSDSMMTEESKASGKLNEKYFSTIVVDFTHRAEKLEKDFVRLDKSASISDLIVDCKEMEKIAIINRFAKFHVRRPQNESETATSSGSTSNSPKPAPERYVKALRGRPTPENTQCLRL